MAEPLRKTGTLQRVDVDDNVEDPGDGASGDRTLGPLAEGCQPSGIPRRNERFSRQANAPSTIAMDVGPVADGHGTTEDHVGGANASSPDANATQRDN